MGKLPDIQSWPYGWTKKKWRHQEKKRIEAGLCHDCRFMPGSAYKDFPHLDLLCQQCYQVRACKCPAKSKQMPGGGWTRCEKCTEWLGILSYLRTYLYPLTRKRPGVIKKSLKALLKVG